MKDYESMTLPELAHELRKIDEQYKEVSKEKTRLYDLKQLISINIIPDKMAEIGVRNITFEEGYRVQLRTDAWCTVNQEQRPKLWAWLDEHGVLQDLKSETINASTLKAYMKELDKNCEELPDEDAISYTPYTQATIVKAR